MAHIVVPHPAIPGLDRYLNVDSKVGPGCPNIPSDVQAVQSILSLLVKASHSSTGLTPLLEINGRFDTVTGFFIFLAQVNMHRRNPSGFKVDGCISAAGHNYYYGSGGIFSIVELNMAAKTADQRGWDAVLQRFPVRGGNQLHGGGPH